MTRTSRRLARGRALLRLGDDLLARADRELVRGEKLLHGNAKFNRSVDRMLGAARVR